MATPLILGVDRDVSSSEDLKVRLSRMPLRFKEGDNDLDEDKLEIAAVYNEVLRMRNKGILAFQNRLNKALADGIKEGIDIINDGVIIFSADGIEASYEKMVDHLMDRGMKLSYNETTGNFEIRISQFLMEDSVRKIQQRQMMQMQGMKRMGG